MDIFLTLFFGLSAIGHSINYFRGGDELIHIIMFGTTLFLTLWFGSLVLA